MDISRRRFIKGSVLTVAGASFANVFASRACADPNAPINLVAGKYLDLPPGFSAFLIEKKGDLMSDGVRVPGAPDGMACFDGGDGTLVLMRNHELGGSIFQTGDGSKLPEDLLYSAAAGGGVSRVVLDSQSFQKISSNLVLGGTRRNCAGGISPWGWLSCEEDTNSGHGYVFLCDPSAESLQPPQKIPAYGRFNHEAAAIEPNTMIAYLTEDRHDSCFYRFLPDSPADPFTGKLQALKIVGHDRYDTSKNFQLHMDLEVEWVDIDDPEPRRDTMRRGGQQMGAAIFKRGEGLWLQGEKVFFTCTQGGPATKGQIFSYEPNGRDRGHLKLVSQADGNELEMPDNLTVSPRGRVYVSEDSSSNNHIRMVRPNGEIKTFARNALSSSEIAGICFDPTGQCMFLNIQKNGLTIGVTGPFDQFEV